MSSVKKVIYCSHEKWWYDFPDHIRHRLYGGKYVGQEQNWVAMRFTGVDEDIDLDWHNIPEFKAWQWISLDHVFDLIVPFKRDIYQKVVAAFGDIADNLPA